MAALYRILALVCIFVFSEANIFQGGGIRSDAVKLPFVTERETTNRITARDVGEVASRLPRAIGRSLKLSAKSFVTSSAMLFPVALVLDINQMKPFDAWLMKGASTSIGWAKVGACFAAAETFFATMRNKEDRFNAYLGSGVTSSILRYNEGPLGMAKGFAAGYGFMFVIDKFVGQDPNLPGTGGVKRLFSFSGFGKADRLVALRTPAVTPASPRTRTSPAAGSAVQPAAPTSTTPTAITTSGSGAVGAVVNAVPPALKAAVTRKSVLRTERGFVTTGFTGLLLPH